MSYSKISIACRTALALTLLGPAVASGAEEPRPLDCVVTPRAQIDLSSAVPGLLDAVLVERSDRVAAGQVVARLESTVERAAVELAKGWAAVETEIRLREVALSHEARKRARLAELYQQRAVALEAKEESDAEVDVTRLRVRQARDHHRLRMLEARKAEAALERRTVRSPVDGVVVQRFRSPGEYVENQPILRVAQLDPLHVETIVPISRFGTIAQGARATVIPEAPAEGRLQATVTVVDAVGDAASGTFGVRLELPNPGYRIPAGLKCKLVFETLRPAEGAPVVGPPSAPLPAPVGEPDAVVVASEVPAERPSAAVGGTVEREAGAAPAPSPGEPAQTPSAASAWCGAIGPVPADRMDRIRAALAAAGITTTPRRRVHRDHTGFLVLSPTFANRDETEAYLRRLKAEGVHDRLLMGHGDFQGRFSLGAYVPLSMAERRRAQLARLGFETEVSPWGEKAVVQWWLDLVHAGPEAGPEAALTPIAPADRAELRIEPSACDGLLADSG